VPALRGVSLSAAPGELLAVTGPSGCGKSTLLNVLGLLDRPDAGTHHLDGEDVGGWPERRRAEVRNRRIGFVFQAHHLLPFLTVRQNLELPFLYSRPAERPAPGQVAEALCGVGLEGLEGRYPGELSGGQQQRVAVARALMREADLILADEPTGDLDADTAQAVLALFEGLAQQGKTVLLVTHDPALAGRAPRRVRLEAGQLVSDGAARQEAHA
jgi:ABC-type lipoprotein export system ATPase subunit